MVLLRLSPFSRSNSLKVCRVEVVRLLAIFYLSQILVLFSEMLEIFCKDLESILRCLDYLLDQPCIDIQQAKPLLLHLPSIYIPGSVESGSCAHTTGSTTSELCSVLCRSLPNTQHIAKLFLQNHHANLLLFVTTSIHVTGCESDNTLAADSKLFDVQFKPRCWQQNPL